MKKETIVTAVCAAITLFLGYELAEERKASKRNEERYNVDLENVAEKVSIEVAEGIHDHVLNEAIEKAANKRVNDILEKAAKNAVDDTMKKMNTEISRRVNSEWDVAKGTVKDKIIARIDHLDISKLKDAAVEGAQDYMLDKMSDKFDELTDKINDKYEDKAEKAAEAARKRFEDNLHRYPYNWSSLF